MKKYKCLNHGVELEMSEEGDIEIHQDFLTNGCLLPSISNPCQKEVGNCEIVEVKDNE